MDEREKVEADGALRRCFCGVPIWFDKGRESATINTYAVEPRWREANGNEHVCPKETAEVSR